MSEYHHYWYGRFGHIGVDRFHREGGYSRGRCREHILRIPVSRSWNIEISTAGKSYRELVDAPKELENLSWVLDEFDANFNDLAVASLRYHLDYSVVNNEDRRQGYENLIARLSEPEPSTTADEDRAMATWEPFTEAVTVNGSTRHQVTECPPLASAAYDSWQERIDAWTVRIDQARHDFVDVMRCLWS
jgi:hypothetical protein